jgi:argininosuccinate lyase
MMPQKRNPYALSMVRGEAGVLIGRLTGLLAVTKTPSARSDGMIFAYGEVPRALQLSTKAVRLMAGVVAGLEVDAHAMRRSLDRSFTQSTDLADVVMQRCDLDYRTAYRTVGEAVRAAAVRGASAADLTPEDLDAAATAVIGRPVGLTAADLADALDPAAVVATRTVPGGAAPPRVREMAARVRGDADLLAEQVAAWRDQFLTAESAVLAHAQARATSPSTTRP